MCRSLLFVSWIMYDKRFVCHVRVIFIVNSYGSFYINDIGFHLCKTERRSRSTCNEMTWTIRKEEMKIG